MQDDMLSRIMIEDLSIDKLSLGKFPAAVELQTFLQRLIQSDLNFFFTLICHWLVALVPGHTIALLKYPYACSRACGMVNC